MTLRIGLSVDPAMPRFLDLAREAERIGVDSVWVAEYWAYDAFTPLAAIASATDSTRLMSNDALMFWPTGVSRRRDSRYSPV